MAKVNIWEELEGVKENLKGEVKVQLGEKTFVFEVKMIEHDRIQEINEEYESDKYPKPKIEVPTSDGGTRDLKVPTDIQKYKRFNTHPKAKEWKKNIEKEKDYRVAYEVLTDEYKPADNPKDGIKLLKERLRYLDIQRIVSKGLELGGFGEQLGKQEDAS